MLRLILGSKWLEKKTNSATMPNIIKSDLLFFTCTHPSVK